jgi:hypothetical protein
MRCLATEFLVKRKETYAYYQERKSSHPDCWQWYSQHVRGAEYMMKIYLLVSAYLNLIIFKGWPHIAILLQKCFYGGGRS